MAANICFEKGLKFDTVFYEHGGSLAQTERFARVLQEYSLAKITKIAATQIRTLNNTAERSGDFGSLGLFARLYFECVAEAVTYGCQIAAPDAAMFEADHTVKQTVGDRLAAEYTLFTGKRVVFTHGALIGDTLDHTQ